MAEKKKKKKKKKAATEPVEAPAAAAADDGVVTSAPASSVGSLLTDLLSEAQREVDEERETLKAQLAGRKAEEQAVKDSSEAAKREEMQRRLIEETRRRNDALTRKQRADATAQAIRDAQPMLASADAVGDFQGRAKEAASMRKWWVVAVVGILAAGGLGAVLAMTRGDLSKATADNADLMTKVKTLTDAKAALTGSVGSLQKQLKEAKSDLGQSTNDRKAAEQKASNLSAKMAEADNKLTEATTALGEVSAKLEELQSKKKRRGPRGLQFNNKAFKKN
jgi:chromosome segregation ATPase